VTGIVALLAKVMPFNFWNSLWPIIIVGFGLVFYALMVAGGRSTAPLAIPGSIITGLGLLMLVQNLTGYWESWAYGWTVILMLVGIGIFIMGYWAENTEQRAAGIRVTKVGLVLFVVFGAFFEGLFNHYPLSEYLLPMLLIGLGAYMVVVRSGLIGQPRPMRRATATTGGKK
jgi:hypothetical protein